MQFNQHKSSHLNITRTENVTYAPFQRIHLRRIIVVGHRRIIRTILTAGSARFDIHIHTVVLPPFPLLPVLLILLTVNENKIKLNQLSQFKKKWGGDNPTYFFEHDTEQKRLFFLNFAFRSTIPHASHFARSPFGDDPTTFPGELACFLPTTGHPTLILIYKKKKIKITYGVVHRLDPYQRTKGSASDRSTACS